MVCFSFFISHCNAVMCLDTTHCQFSGFSFIPFPVIFRNLYFFCEITMLTSRFSLFDIFLPVSWNLSTILPKKRIRNKIERKTCKLTVCNTSSGLHFYRTKLNTFRLYQILTKIKVNSTSTKLCHTKTTKLHRI